MAITRSLTHEELKDYKWKYYLMAITGKTTKEDIVKFTNALHIKTNELAFDKYPIYINTVSTDIIIITNKGEKLFARYDHIFKNNSIKIEINGKWINWSQAKNKIKKIIFLDSLYYHNSVRHIWSENGYNSIKFYNQGLYDELKNDILSQKLA